MTLSMNTQLQNFWVESINKEASLRFAWHLRYSKQFSKSGWKPKPQKSESHFRSSVSERIKKMESERRPRSSLLATGTQREEDARLTKSDGALSMRDMRPPSAYTRSLLFNGISAHGEGRYAYLKKRRSLTPEKKYEFPILSSCQYGWKIGECKNPKSSAHARTCVIKDTFYRNSGIILG